MEMQKINESLTREGGVKKYEKVVERVGRSMQKYPSISKYDTIEYVRSESKPQ